MWSLWDQNIPQNMVKVDWSLIAWSAKWLGESTIMYQDARHAKDFRKDRPLLGKIWSLMDQADIILTQNGKIFDIKKLNAKFLEHGYKPPSSFKQIDTKWLSKKHFGFPSHSLLYMTEKLCKKYKKLDHKEFPGFELWLGCMGGDIKAWRCMEKYNKHDVLALEELYTIIMPWDSSLNVNLWNDDLDHPKCKCGNDKFQRYGFAYTQVSKFQRYRCTKCGTETRSGKNLFTKDDRDKIRRGTVR